MGDVIFNFFSIQQKLVSGITNRDQSRDQVNDVTIPHHFHD